MARPCKYTSDVERAAAHRAAVAAYAQRRRLAEDDSQKQLAATTPKPVSATFDLLSILDASTLTVAKQVFERVAARANSAEARMLRRLTTDLRVGFLAEVQAVLADCL